MNPNILSSGNRLDGNPTYPMSNMRGSAYSAPLGFNQSTEVLSGYDAQIDPMTGQERPQVNFAGGGIASLVASPYRDSDVMQVKMTPREVAGLQQLALSYGARPEDLYDPITGQPKFSFLKKILPMIAGAVLPSIPGVGEFAKTIGFGSQALGTSLLVGGATGLIEGDLKKGLMAGLGAYSGAKISEGLSASASKVGGAEPPVKTESTVERAIAPAPRFTEEGAMIPQTQAYTPPPPPPVSIKPTVAPPPAGFLSTMGQGISGLMKPEGRTAFMDAMGGGLSKSAVFLGAMDAFTPEQKPFPTGAAGEDIVYIPGGFNPMYGTGRDQPYQLPGRYYKRTAQGLVPYNPWQMAPGYGQPAPAFPGRGTGPKGRGFADGGPVAVSPYAAPTNDPNVLATRAYVEELNRRARNPVVQAYPAGAGTGGLGSFGAYTYQPSAGGTDAGVGAAPSVGAGDIIGGLATSYLLNKGVESGIGYLRDKIFADPTIKRAQETPVTDDLQGVDLSKLPATQAALAALSPFSIPEPPQYSVGVEEVPDAATEPTVTTQPAVTPPATSAIPFTSPLLSPFVAPPPSPIYSVGVEELTTPEVQQPAQVGGDLSKPLSSYLSGASALGSGLAGLSGLGKAASIGIELPVYDALGNLVGYGAAPGAAAAGAASAAGASGAGAAGEAGAEAAKAGLGKSAIIPGLQTVLGAYETFKGIESGKESQAALGGFGLGAGLAGLGGAGVSSLSGLAALGAGPVGIAAAALAAIGASMVNTKEYGDVALRNYWNAIDEGRGFGQAPPEELAQGFINFYRTNKNQFAGQEKYGRTGNEDFVYDMTQVINDAIKSGKVGKDVDAPTMYKEVVQPWLNSMGSGPQNADARRVQDFMMTDLIYNFMQGKPISNAQVKGDKKFKIVSEKPVYAGAAPVQETKQPEFQNIPAAAAAIRQAMEARSPFAAPEERASIMPTGETVPVVPNVPFETLPGPGLAGDDGRVVTQPYGETVPIAPEQQIPSMARPEDFISTISPIERPGYVDREVPPAPVQEFVGTPYMPQPDIQAVSPYQAPVSPGPRYAQEDPEFYRRALQDIVSETRAVSPYEEPAYVPREEATPINPFEDASYNPFEDYSYNPFEGFSMTQFAAGGAIGEGFNFGFANGGRPMEYRAGGKFLRGPGDGMSDDIKANIDGKQEARLADGEFVIPADVVSHLGNGSSNAGAKKLHQMMARVRKARTGRKKQAPAVKMDRYLPA